ncbi:hypothetical protein BH09BAC1_BH09BAC1_19000 [soil metagenome]
MDRRDFIKKSAMAAGAISLPYLLPGGTLFAPTGSRIANHVVFCLFAGGVRNLESMHKMDGNLMPNILTGNESISPDIVGGMSSLPSPASTRLQTIGTLFREFRYKQGPTGHYGGHNTVLTGRYDDNVSLSQRPKYPTVFELYRKHSSPEQAALNSWWVSNSLGPYPALNFSDDPQYGALYGANYVQPASMIVGMPQDPLQLDDVKLEKVAAMRNFMDNNFSSKVVAKDAGIANTTANRKRIEEFLRAQYQSAVSGQYNSFWGLAQNSINNDQITMFFAEQVIKEFHPELLVVNMQDVDTCHQSYTRYANNIRKADYAVAKLWETIQSTPGMANDTILIVAPEHGRNLQPNTIRDQYGRYALDHTSDPTSREIFCLMVGPPSKVKQNQLITQQVGESIDIVPTIARILGFDTNIPGGRLLGRHLGEAFV